VAIRDRLCPAPGQEQVLRLHCDHARYVWNLAVEQQSWWWPGRGRAPGYVDQAHQLAAARAAEPWLRGGSSSVQQQALRDFDLAMAAFFDPRNPAAKPGYRSKRRVQGFAVRDTKVRRLKPKPDTGQPGAFLPNGARAKAGLSKAILASCWGTLGRRLADKGAASGVSVLFVDPRFTSQQCHVCGHTQAANRESQAVFRCQQCGHHDHADRNAARNILARGLATLSGQVPARAPGHGASCPRQPPAPAGAAGTTRSAA
jgi:transposase